MHCRFVFAMSNRHGICNGRSNVEEVPQYLDAAWSQKTLWMKLQPKHRKPLMADGHDFALAVGQFAPGGDFIIVGEGAGADDKAVIPRRLERIGQPGEESAAVMMNSIDLAVH